MKRRTLNFPTTKRSCGTRWGKNGRSGFILAWRMDDGWWGHQRNNNKKKKTTTTKQENETTLTQTTPAPNEKENKSSNLKQTQQLGSNRYRREMFMCASQGKKTKCNGKETNIMSCNCSYDWKQGEEWQYEFLCQHGEKYSMYECVWLHVATIWGEGTVFS